jgi:hypothetical protein
MKACFELREREPVPSVLRPTIATLVRERLRTAFST